MIPSALQQPTHRPSWVQRVLATLLLLATAIFLHASVDTIARYGWRQPMLDQYRSYPLLLAQSFPNNITTAENGHRPILPNLIKLADAYWFSASQDLLLMFGTLCALVTAALIALVAWRERGLPLALRAAGVLLPTLGIFWLGNARMLVHGNESASIYPLALAVVLATLCVKKASVDSRSRWLWLASLCAVCATFSFGTGAATFAAILFLGGMVRLRWQRLLIPASALLLTMWAYLVLLPGDGSVRGVLELRPLDNLTTAAQLLGSPWVNAVLGLAEPPSGAWLRDTVAQVAPGGLLVASVDFMTRPFGAMVFTRVSAIVIGTIGVTFLVLALVAGFRRGAQASALSLVGLGLACFGAGTALLVAFARLDLFAQHPEQVFADRYLVWLCLFWCGLALVGLDGVIRLKAKSHIAAPLVVMLLLATLVLWPTHKSWIGWAAASYRNVQRSAVAARMDIFDTQVFHVDAEFTRELTLGTLGLLRERQLAMFAHVTRGWVGNTWPSGSKIAPMAGATAHLTDTFIEPLGEKPVARFEGGIAERRLLKQLSALIVLDTSERVVGLAEFSFSFPGTKSRWPSPARHRGFDGYIRDFNTEGRYRLVGIGRDGSALGVLATFGPDSRNP